MKVIITGLHSSGKNELWTKLKEEGYNCGQLFSNMENNTYNSNNYMFYDDNTIHEIFENRAYTYIKQVYTKDTLTTFYEGLSKYDFDNNDIFVFPMNMIAEMNIIDPANELLIIWIDDIASRRFERYKQERRKYNFDDLEAAEYKYANDFSDRIYGLKNTHILYFTNEELDRIKTIVKTYINYPEMREEIIKNFK